MKKILIVDDEPDILEVLGKRLIDAGYQVIKAQNGEEAIEKAKSELPNLIILDIVMPDIDGGEVAEVLKEYEATKNIPVIYLTCLYTKKEEKEVGHLIKENFFVAKPYDATELLNIIRQNIYPLKY